MSYNKDSIKSLSIIDHIRLRPGVYAPDVEIQGLHHLLEEVINNSVDEYLQGYGNEIKITIDNSNGRCLTIVEDKGRGIPVGFRKDLNKDVLTSIFTDQFTGGKFDSTNYKTSAGLNGVGLKAVNALSKSMTITSSRDGASHTQKFEKGIPVSGIDKVPCKSTGTKISYEPDETIFTTTVYDYDLLKWRFKCLASILPGLNVSLDYSNSPSTSEQFIWCEKEKLSSIHNDSIKSTFDSSEQEIFNYKYDSKDVSIILTYHKSSKNVINAFCNTIHNYDHGSHVDAVYNAIINALKKHTGKVFTRSQIMNGLCLTISIFFQEPGYRGQHKGKIADSRIQNLVYNSIYNTLFDSLGKNKDFLNYIVELIVSQEKIVQELEIKKATSFIKSSVRECKLPLKLSIAHNCKPEDRELFIVEGDSAGGGVKTACNKRFQEVLPIKGKIINAFKTSYTDLLKSQEVLDVFLSVGSMENTNTPLRTHNTFILTDSDVDGYHIATLLLSLFLVAYPSYIKNYNLYIVHTPLFTLMSDDIRMYGHDVKSVTAKFKSKYGNKSYEIHRNKGLGEMDPEEIEEVIDPKTRVVTKINLTKDSFVELEKLMGAITDIRRLLVEDMEKDDIKED